MRHDPVELGLAVDARARRDRPHRSRRTGPTAAQPSGAQEAHAPLALDEAFALLARDQTRTGEAHTARGGDLQAAACEALSGSRMSQADNRSVCQLSTAEQRIQRQRKLVDKLAAQLFELDRQRDQLAQLLRDIESDELIGRLET